MPPSQEGSASLILLVRENVRGELGSILSDAAGIAGTIDRNYGNMLVGDGPDSSLNGPLA